MITDTDISWRTLWSLCFL